MILDRVRAARGGWQPEDLGLRITVPEQRIIIASDVQIPYYDEELLASMFQIAKSLRVEAIVWLGDLMDMPRFSSFGIDDTSTTFERELRITEAVLREAGDLGVRQYWSYGNHEARLLKKLSNEILMERLADMVGVSDLVNDGRLVISDNPTLQYRDNWILTHPAQYGSTPLVIPGSIADIEQMNVVAGHAHHWGLGKSPSGKFTVIESGGLFEPRFMRYIQHRPSKHRAQTKGFVILEHGIPHLVDGSGSCPAMGSKDESIRQVRGHGGGSLHPQSRPRLRRHRDHRTQSPAR